jgi:hypothetical protein
VERVWRLLDHLEAPQVEVTEHDQTVVQLAIMASPTGPERTARGR